MKHRFAYPALALVLGGLTAAVLQVRAAPVSTTPTDKVQDRKAFIPHRKYEPLKGKVVGLLVSEVAPKMGHEGRGGPPDAMGFSANQCSYRWVYVPVDEKPLITALRVKTGEKGTGEKVYPSLSMATAQTVKKWNIEVPYALVEVEVNDGDAAPADEGFVATKMTRLDGTKDFPLDVTKVVKELKQKYAEWQTAEEKKLEAALGEAAKKALDDRKPTGPREKTELMYLTWLADKQVLRVHFRTTLTDGDYKYSGGGAQLEGPFPLPPPPKPGKNQAFGAFPPPPPREMPKVRYGTQFGIEYGMAYEVGKSGKVERMELLTVEHLKTELPPPPVGGPGGVRPIDPLPPVKD